MAEYDATHAQIEALETYHVCVITETRTGLTARQSDVGEMIFTLNGVNRSYLCRVIAIQNHEDNPQKQLTVVVPA